MDDPARDAFLTAAELVPDEVYLRLDTDLVYIVLDLVAAAEEGVAWEPLPFSNQRERLDALHEQVHSAHRKACDASGSSNWLRRAFKLKRTGHT